MPRNTGLMDPSLLDDVVHLPLGVAERFDDAAAQSGRRASGQCLVASPCIYSMMHRPRRQECSGFASESSRYRRPARLAVGACETGAKGYERQVRRMAKLIYSMIMSLDGYTEDEHGQFGWGAPEDEVLSFINELGSAFGIYLYGRRMYETMVYWETAHTLPDQTPFELDFGASGRRPTRLFIRGPSPNRAARTGLSGSSMPTRCGGSRQARARPDG